MPAPAKNIVLRSESVEAKIDPRTFSVHVTDKTAGQAWKMADDPFDEVVVERDGKVTKETLAGAPDVVTRRLGEGGVLFEFPSLRLGLLLMLEENRLTFELIPREENERFQIKGVVYPRPFVLEKTSDDFLLVPFDQGLMIPGNYPESIGAYGDLYQFGDEERMRTYGELFDCDVNWWSSYRPTYAPAFENNMLMPWWASGKKKGSVLMVLDEACWADSYLLATHPAGGPTSWRLMWLPSKGRLRYPRRVVFHFMKGGYVHLAKAYRKIAAERGKIVTLAEKKKRLPQMSKLVGAPFLGVGFLKHSYQRYEHAVAMTFRDAAERIEAFAKKTGLKKLHVHARSWQQRGHDIQYPDLVPPAPDCGGPAAFDELATRVQKLGYAFGLGGDNYHDVAMDSPLFDESMLLRYANGKTNRRNMWASGLTSLICHKVALKYLRRNFEVGRTDYPATKGLLETAHPDSYWIGNYVSGYECYDERHPMTRNTCWDAQREIFQYIVDKNLLLNNEHPKDWACPYFYAARTRQVSQQVYGFNQRGIGAVAKPAPLWSLVYRDCCIPGGDSTLLEMMNGAPPHVRLDDADNAERIETVKLQAKLQGVLMFDEMTDHELLSEDSAVQRSTFASGATVTIDQHRHAVKIEGVKGIDRTEVEVVEAESRR